MRIYYLQSVDRESMTAGLDTEPASGRVSLTVSFDELARDWSWYGKFGGVTEDSLVPLEQLGRPMVSGQQ